MLKQRIFTALALVMTMVALLFWLPPLAFQFFVALVVALVAFEWAALAGCFGGARLAYVASIVLVGALLIFAPAGGVFHFGLLIEGVVLWALLSLRVFLGTHVPDIFHQAFFKLLLAPLVLWPTWFALERLYGLPAGAWWVLGTLVVVWVADSSAYFAGRVFGRVKLAPHISPGKTVEGLVGALLGVAIYAAIAHQFEPFAQVPLAAWCGLAVLVTLFSVIGDLHESLLKREAGVKDSGTLLPGHGGVFDRVDSLLAAAPIMAFGLYALGVDGVI
ncbi:MAG: phosphatidate cytidylyltransferase [Halothiobacillaceae bacterium]